MGNVIRPKTTRFKIPVSDVARGMIENKLDPVIVVGLTPDNMLCVQSSTATVSELVLLLEQAKLELIRPTQEEY